ncbi:MAG: phosphate ABC transporter substrate-binding/OmpA family protein [Pseudomonadota bacterium]
MTFGKLKRGTALSRIVMIAALGLASTGALANEVSLKSADGTVNLTGEFVDFVDDNYIIRTALGELRISAARVRCEGAACPSFEDVTADVTIAGSDTVGEALMPLLMSGFAGSMDAESSVVATSTATDVVASFVGDAGFGDELGSFLIRSTVSGDAFDALLDGTAEVGMAARRITPNEARALRDAGAGNMVSPSQEHIIAVESMVVILHPSNPLDTLNKEQLRDIYEGRVTNWSELGGNDEPIRVGAREAETGSRAVFEDRVFLGDRADLVSGAFIAQSNNDLAAFVNSEPGGIGYVGYAFQRGAKPITVVNHCGMPMTPNVFAAKTEEYALNRRIYLYNTDDGASDWASDLIEFAMSPEADSVITKAGFINLGVQRQSQSSDSARAQMLQNANVDAFERGIISEMLTSMQSHDRLSTTFRFRTGSSRLDERARIDMIRLVDYLQTLPEGTSVKVVGFTDDVGPYESNLVLSKDRAASVLGSLQAEYGDALTNVTFSSTGYGETAPATCNTDDQGRSINRRVEIWVESGTAS